MSGLATAYTNTITVAMSQSVREEGVIRLVVEGLDNDRQADSERRMVTPWNSRIVGNALPLSIFPTYQSKFFFAGLYERSNVSQFKGFNLSR
jgi:hypothetical protein